MLAGVNRSSLTETVFWDTGGDWLPGVPPGLPPGLPLFGPVVPPPPPQAATARIKGAMKAYKRTRMSDSREVADGIGPASRESTLFVYGSRLGQPYRSARVSGSPDRPSRGLANRL